LDFGQLAKKNDCVILQMREKYSYMKKKTIWDNLRIIWAIASKDIVDAIRNKTTISIVIGIGVLMLSAQALPLILQLRDVKAAIVYHPGDSVLIRELAQQRDFQMRRVPSLTAMEESLAEAGEVQIGLVIPGNLDAHVAADEGIELQGHFVYWAKPAEVEEINKYFERKLGELIGIPVEIDLDNPAVYPGPDTDGQPFMISLSLVVAVITIGAFLVPYLIVEEKEKHTIEALMVSPASYSQVVAGKAIAGLFYCLVAAAVVFAIYFPLISQWWLAIVGALVGALFTVSVGLLVGSIFDNPGSMNLWLGLVLLVLMLPVLMGQLISSNLPQIVTDLLPLLPSVAMSKVIRMSFSSVVLTDHLLQNLGVMIVGAGVLLSLTAWKIRRLDRG
jgi:ABC-type transport system involved in multi-copper enzyme maturation permease subunit